MANNLHGGGNNIGIQEKKRLHKYMPPTLNTSYWFSLLLPYMLLFREFARAAAP